MLNINFLRYALFILVVLFFFSCSSVKEKDQFLFPKNAVKLKFKEASVDSLLKIQDFERIDGTDIMIGFISAIKSTGTHILLSDHKQNKVFAIDAKTFKYAFTIGNGRGQGPEDLNGPFGIEIINDQIMIANDTGPFLYSFYSLDGKYIKSIPRKSFDYNSSIDMSSFMADSIIYATVGIARDLKKVRTYDLRNFSNGPNILPVADFQTETDSIMLSKSLSRLFIHKSGVDGDKLYGIPGNKPLVNSYTLKGKLIKSYDLRTIPVLNNYCIQIAELLTPPDDRGISGSLNYFSNVAMDEKDNLIFPAQEVLNINQIRSKAIPVDSMKVKTYLVAVNVNEKKYKLHKIDRGLAPMRIINNQIWCFDATGSRVVVYKLPD